MCLISLAWKPDDRYLLVVAANRDERHDRPTAPLSWWSGDLSILAGRDLQAGGTWMGVSPRGRFAAITNFRDSVAPPAGAQSRGAIVSDFLTIEEDTESWLDRFSAQATEYAGFNLFVADRANLAVTSNRGEAARLLDPDVYGLSNGPWKSRWPKVRRAISAMREGLASDDLDESLFEMLRDETPAETDELPDTGVGPDQERHLSSIFIRDAFYGTRSSAVCVISLDGTGRITERSWSPSGELTNEVTEEFAWPLDRAVLFP